MKKTIIIFIILNAFLINNIFSQKYSGTDEIKRPVLLGINFSPGATWQLSETITNGENSPSFALNTGIKGMFHFSNSVGIISGLQINNMVLKEKSNTLTREYNLVYFQLTLGPFIRYKNLFFSTGMYMGFIIKGTKTENGTNTITQSDYTMPDLGLILSFGYLLKTYKTFHIYLDIKLKYEMNDFLKNSLSSPSSKIFGLYFDISFLFNLVTK